MVLIAFSSYHNYLRQQRTVYILSEENVYDVNHDENKNEIIQRDMLSDNKIIVHVEGEVMNPGIYKLESDARVVDAVKAAGGLKEEADTKKVNLAKKIFDEEFIYIPSKDDEDFQITQLPNPSTNDGSSSLMNINIAGKEELQKLPGIGPALAERIIEYRNQVGGFSNIEEIKNVSGIGDKKYTDIKDKITIK